jgi:hypothetical protein
MGISSVLGTRSLFDYLMPSSKERQDPATEMLLGGASTNSGASDVLDISAEGEAAAGLFDRANATTGSNTIRLPDLEEAHERMFASMQAKLSALFDKNGIDTSKDVKLQVGYDGSVIVVGDHPQKAQIEQFFKDDPDLRNEFARLQGLTEFIGAARESQAFQAAYAKDPYAAIAQFSYLFDNSVKPSAYLLMKGDTCEAVYQRGPHREVISPATK